MMGISACSRGTGPSASGAERTSSLMKEWQYKPRAGLSSLGTGGSGFSELDGMAWGIWVEPARGIRTSDLLITKGLHCPAN